MGTTQQKRPHFASHHERHRRRRRIALGALVAVVALPVLLLTAFRGGSSRALGEGWIGGKLPRRDAAPIVGAARQRTAVERLLRLDLPIYCAGGTGRYVALTFDDGPSELTPEFHALLREFGARATFFIVGANMKSETFTAYAREDAKLGSLGDHTWLHTALAGLDEARVTDEIVSAKRAIAKATNAPIVVFRPPFASRDATTQRVVSANRMLMILWNTDSRDWSGATWQKIGANVVRGLVPGSIVLMHDTRSETVKALRNVIFPELRRRRLQAVTLPELFALDPPTEAQLRDDASRGACSRGQYDSP